MDYVNFTIDNDGLDIVINTLMTTSLSYNI